MRDGIFAHDTASARNKVMLPGDNHGSIMWSVCDAADAESALSH